MIKVAVSGVGGGIGQSILKALSICSLPVQVFPLDVTPFSAGLYRGTQAGTVLPKPETPEGLRAWADWLEGEGIAALIPGSDFDVEPLARARAGWSEQGLTRVLVSDLELVKTCRDKVATHRLLNELGLPSPRSAWDLSLERALAWADANGYPVILKPRNGFASRNVRLITQPDELAFFWARTPNPMLQEWLNLDGKEIEFTCAVFVDDQGLPVGTFMARRELNAGATYLAEVGFWQDIHDHLLAVGRALRPRGPINVQLRMTERGPVPFEFNIRCSGTSAIRAYFGFNEPEMLLRHYLQGEKLTPPQVRRGFVMRYWNEVFLEDVDQGKLMENPGGLKGQVLAWP